VLDGRRERDSAFTGGYGGLIGPIFPEFPVVAVMGGAVAHVVLSPRPSASTMLLALGVR